jgi:hypothetical protein
MCHPRRLWGLHRHQKERGSAPGAVFGKTGRLSVVLAGDFLGGSAERMTMVVKSTRDPIGLDIVLSAGADREMPAHSLWVRLRMNFGTSGPGI